MLVAVGVAVLVRGGGVDVVVVVRHGVGAEWVLGWAGGASQDGIGGVEGVDEDGFATAGGGGLETVEDLKGGWVGHVAGAQFNELDM